MNAGDPPFTIVRDTREKKGHGWFFPEDGYCTGTVVEKLDTGDYSVKGLEDYVCVERKESITEWSMNCAKSRWKKCLQRMSEIRHPYLILEFSREDLYNFPKCKGIPKYVQRRIRMPAALLRKNIYRAREEYGIHVYLCPHKVKAAKLTYTILKRAYEISIRRRII
jgi:hypothetical protein